MMKIGIPLAMCLIVNTLSCTQIEKTVNDDVSGNNEYDRVVMVMPSCEFDEEVQTKNEVLLSNGIRYVWSETDTVGIFPTQGSQLFFSMASGAGEVTAAFDGGGWALVKGADYYSYFPFVPDFYIDKTAIPLAFDGQTQVGNADPLHAYLGNYCYMAAKGVYDEQTDALYFNYQRLGILFRFMIPVKAGSYKSLTIAAGDNKLVKRGTFDAIKTDQVINDAEYADSLTLEFSELSLDSDGTLVAFMMLPPFDMASKQLTFELLAMDGVKHIASVAGKSYVLGKTYNNAPTYSASLSQCEIGAEGGSVILDIIASGSSEYTVTTDVDWLSPSVDIVNGTSSVVVTVSANSGAMRSGHIIVSETSGGMQLDNEFTVIQDMSGVDVSIDDWEQNQGDLGGVAE